MATWDEVVRVDQRGTYAAAVVFGTRMAARRRGSIVNIASVAGMRSMPLHRPMRPAKAAVIAVTWSAWRRSGAGPGEGERRVSGLHADTRIASCYRQGRA